MFISNRRDGASPDDYSLKSTLARQELEADKHLIKLIQTACKAENLPAAFDATLMLSQPGSLGAAAKIAAFFHLPTLEERIARAVEEKAGGRRGDEENKRELKWTHRVDERTILAPTAGSGREGASGWFGSTPMSSTFQSEAPRRAPVVQGRRVEDLVEESTWGGGSDGFEADESMQVEEYDSGVEERSPKRPRSDGEGEDEGQQGSDGAEELPPPPVAPALKKGELNRAPIPPLDNSADFYSSTTATNPFSKRLVPKGPPPASQANPFAAKKGGKANDVKRTDSFFGRVEGREAPKGSYPSFPPSRFPFPDAFPLSLSSEGQGRPRSIERQGVGDERQRRQAEADHAFWSPSCRSRTRREGGEEAQVDWRRRGRRRRCRAQGEEVGSEAQGGRGAGGGWRGRGRGAGDPGGYAGGAPDARRDAGGRHRDGGDAGGDSARGAFPLPFLLPPSLYPFSDVRSSRSLTA